jgi:putative ABC transport system permease protein
MRRKYFGDTNPLGHTMTILFDTIFCDVQIVAIAENVPSNSTIEFDFLLSFELMKYIYEQRILDSWTINVPTTYLRVASQTDVDQLATRITGAIQQHIGETRTDEIGRMSFRLQPLLAIHLDPDWGNDPIYCYLLGGIGIVLLLVGCINFIVLTLGNFDARTREVGIRKALGAKRSAVIRQYLTEALVISVFATALGVGLAELLLTEFNEIAGRSLTLSLFGNPALLVALAVIALLTGLIAGWYPAWRLARLSSSDNLRRGSKSGTGQLRFSYILMLGQFAVAVFLIIGTSVMMQQNRFMQQRSLGYNQEQILTVEVNCGDSQAVDLLKRFRDRLSNQPTILGVTGYAFGFGDPWIRIYKSDDGTTFSYGDDLTAKSIDDYNAEVFYTNFVDENYLTVFDIPLIEGRDFSGEHPTDSANAVVINRSAMRLFGWDHAAGKALPYGLRDRHIIGVVDDFHFYPMHRSIEPLVINFTRAHWLTRINEIAIRINGDDLPATLSLIEETWNDVSKGLPFSHNFVDQRVAAQYEAEQNATKMAMYASILAIAVACLGLFGVTSMVVARRRKEIAVRKVFGGTIAGLISYVSQGILRYVLIGSVLAIPGAYVLMNRWLETFAYRINLGFGVIATACLLAIGLAIVTIFYQVARAALTNPVEVLHNE